MILALARRLPACEIIAPLVSEARERPLAVREKITVKLHLFTCEACRRYVAQIERISRTVKPAAENETFVNSPVQLSDEARKRIKAALEAAAQQKH